MSCIKVVISMREKLDEKITITMTQEDKTNLDSDIPLLDRMLKDRVGAKITIALFHRLCSQDLHNKIARGQLIEWPPRLLVQKSKGGSAGKSLARAKGKS
jgi:hypothetical protein